MVPKIKFHVLIFAQTVDIALSSTPIHTLRYIMYVNKKYGGGAISSKYPSPPSTSNWKLHCKIGNAKKIIPILRFSIGCIMPIHSTELHWTLEKPPTMCPYVRPCVHDTSVCPGHNSSSI